MIPKWIRIKPINYVVFCFNLGCEKCLRTVVQCLISNTASTLASASGSVLASTSDSPLAAASHSASASVSASALASDSVRCPSDSRRIPFAVHPIRCPIKLLSIWFAVHLARCLFGLLFVRFIFHPTRYQFGALFVRLVIDSLSVRSIRCPFRSPSVRFAVRSRCGHDCQVILQCWPFDSLFVRFAGRPIRCSFGVLSVRFAVYSIPCLFGLLVVRFAVLSVCNLTTSLSIQCHNPISKIPIRDVFRSLSIRSAARSDRCLFGSLSIWLAVRSVCFSFG